MELYYGNIAQEYLELLKVENIFTNYKNEFLLANTPNFYESTQEIEKILDIQKKAMESKEWESIKKFCMQWDGDIIESFAKTLKKMNIPANDEYLEYLADVSQDFGALIMQLKNTFQRARPYQVAYYSNLPLHPFETHSGNTPSYPSGHAGQGYFICSVIANHYPEKAKELRALAMKIAESRVIMGIHFPSDNLFGMEIANELMGKDDIKSKYFSDVEEANI
jgi:hypothetical protein